MVILIIQVEDFSFGLVDSERDPPVAGNGEAPCSLAVAGKLMRFPGTWDVVQSIQITFPLPHFLIGIVNFLTGNFDLRPPGSSISG